MTLCVLRYALLTPETYPTWHGSVQDGIKHLLASVNMEPDQWQLGRTKVFIKSPESVSAVITMEVIMLVCVCSCSCWRNWERESMIVTRARSKRRGDATDQTSTTRRSRRKVSTFYTPLLKLTHVKIQFTAYTACEWFKFFKSTVLTVTCLYTIASDILLNKKERKRLSINRNFVGDYLGFSENPSLRALVGMSIVPCLSLS